MAIRLCARKLIDVCTMVAGKEAFFEDDLKTSPWLPEHSNSAKVFLEVKERPLNSFHCFMVITT